MNNTTKQKYELAKKMLKGKIEIDEVALMTGLSEEVLKELKEEVAPESKDVQILKNLDTVDLDIGQILYDDFPDEDIDTEE
ncbi:MAG: hypothetical protein NC393_01390 [Clostridium sp.]|nr:hypothetical protein [Clostridium sp.]MCM1170757.1 hypothetical protein [Clostridium sp.]MCM1207630.1 hypothetical protein [Ruminococcus sp.]MCM1287049.1 hypothetical protein [Clostridium sp.]